MEEEVMSERQMGMDPAKGSDRTVVAIIERQRGATEVKRPSDEDRTWMAYFFEEMNKEEDDREACAAMTPDQGQPDTSEGEDE